MSLRRVSLHLAGCDGCGQQCWENHAGAPPLFDTPLTARKKLAEEYGWRIVIRVHGRFLMFCKSCAKRAECELFGCDPGAADGVRLAACSRCGDVSRADAPPADHPDSVVEGLPEWLAVLDHEIFPEETR